MSIEQFTILPHHLLTSPSSHLPMPPSYTAALLLARTLVHSGLTQVVISPGSRSTPLTTALVAQPDLHAYPALDERGAAFFALGLALASGKPAALVCTSGTAAANYYPAVIEANQSRIPLLLLTADRPHELRDSGANQTIDQIRLYGSHVRWFVDVHPPEDTPSQLTQRALRTLAARALYATQHPIPGPVHINLPYRKPLEPSSPAEIDNIGEGLRILAPNLLPSAEQIHTITNLLRQCANPLILCGPRCPQGDFATQIVNLARKTNATLIADIASGLRFGAHVTRHPLHSPAILQNPAFPAPTLVLQFGAFPVDAAVERYLNALPPQTIRIAVTPHADFPDPTHRLNLLIHTNPTALLQAVNALYTGGQGNPHLSDGARDEAPHASVESGAGCEGSNLVLASSLPIRIADSQWQSHPIPLRVFANRGASGIDGTIATAAGIAAATSNAPFTLLFIGDVAFYHDLNSLHLLRHAAHPVIIVLLNNNGGRIFEQLPIAEHSNLLNDWFVMPHGLTFQGAAQTFGLQYHRLNTLPDLPQILQLARSTTAHTIVEILTFV